MSYVAVIAISILVGWTELMSRYRDSPFMTAITRGGFIYLAINALASISAMFLLDTFGPTAFDNYAEGVQRDAARVLVAGFGAVIVLRSSLFRVRVDQTDISIGPSAVLDVLLRVADRDVDRNRAFSRADKIPGLLMQLSPKVVREELPPLCLALMQNLSSEEQKALSDQLNLINNQKELSETSKAIQIGLLLSGFVGLQVLDRAIRSILDRPADVPPVQPMADAIRHDLARDRGAGSGGG